VDTIEVCDNRWWQKHDITWHDTTWHSLCGTVTGLVGKLYRQWQFGLYEAYGCNHFPESLWIVSCYRPSSFYSKFCFFTYIRLSPISDVLKRYWVGILRFALSYCTSMVNPWQFMILRQHEWNMHILHENSYLITISSAANGFGNCFFSDPIKHIIPKLRLQGKTGLTCNVNALNLNAKCKYWICVTCTHWIYTCCVCTGLTCAL
jgi:hypothetical protein